MTEAYILTISGIKGRRDITVKIMPLGMSARVLEQIHTLPGRRAGELAETLDEIVFAVAGAISGLAQGRRIRKVVGAGGARWYAARRRSRARRP